MFLHNRLFFKHKPFWDQPVYILTAPLFPPVGLEDYLQRYRTGMRRVLSSTGPVPQFSGEAAERITKVTAHHCHNVHHGNNQRQPHTTSRCARFILISINWKWTEINLILIIKLSRENTKHFQLHEIVIFISWIKMINKLVFLCSLSDEANLRHYLHTCTLVTFDYLWHFIDSFKKRIIWLFKYDNHG